MSGEVSLPLCPGETLPEQHGLRPAVEPSVQERHGPIGLGPEEGHREAERVEAVQPGEEKASGMPSCGLAVPEGALQES